MNSRTVPAAWIALERKLDVELACACAELARLRAEGRELQQAHAEALRACAMQQAWASGEQHRMLDAARHERVLRYLLSLRLEISQSGAVIEQIEERIVGAASECAGLDRQRGAIVKLREQAERRECAEQARRGLREADHAWTARQSTLVAIVQRSQP